jgi:serine/threonine-protein kinase
MIGRDEQQRAVLVMKRIEGDNWRSMLEDPHHPRWNDAKDSRLARNLRILIQVCHAVEHAHSRNLLHRDIKTDNIMIGDFGQVYLIDWGVSVDLRDPAQQKTTSRFVGTPCFAAPEMATPDSQLGPAVDVYLLGGTLYDVLTGRVPREGTNVLKILKNISTPLELTFAPDIPGALAQICHKALAHEPDDRYRSVASLREAIEQFLNHRFFLDQLATAQSTLDEMRSLKVNRQLDVDSSSRMMNISHKCRFALESVIENEVEVEIAKEMLAECLALQIEYTIASRELRVARILTNQLQQMVGPENPMVVQLSKRIAEAFQAKSTRELELSVQIQTKLLESIQYVSAEPTNSTDEE